MKANEMAVPLKVQKLIQTVAGFTLTADFEVHPGERAAILGASGQGKSTLLRIIAGLEPIQNGRIFLGAEITALPPQKREIGFVFQDAALFPALSILENAAFGLRVRGVTQEERRAQVLPWLTKLGMAHRADQSVRGLSGGEKQRLAFVRALVWKPRLILLDEPFSALDREMREALTEDLKRLHGDWPVPLLLVSHDEEDVQKLATRKFKIVNHSLVENAVSH